MTDKHGELSDLASYTYCQGHGYQVLLGQDMRAQARECDLCNVVERGEPA